MGINFDAQAQKAIRISPTFQLYRCCGLLLENRYSKSLINQGAWREKFQIIIATSIVTRSIFPNRDDLPQCSDEIDRLQVPVPMNRSTRSRRNCPHAKRSGQRNVHHPIQVVRPRDTLELYDESLGQETPTCSCSLTFSIPYRSTVRHGLRPQRSSVTIRNCPAKFQFVHHRSGSPSHQGSRSHQAAAST